MQVLSLLRRCFLVWWLLNNGATIRKFRNGKIVLQTGEMEEDAAFKQLGMPDRRRRTHEHFWADTRVANCPNSCTNCTNCLLKQVQELCFLRITTKTRTRTFHVSPRLTDSDVLNQYFVDNAIEQPLANYYLTFILSIMSITSIDEDTIRILHPQSRKVLPFTQDTVDRLLKALNPYLPTRPVDAHSSGSSSSSLSSSLLPSFAAAPHHHHHHSSAQSSGDGSAKTSRALSPSLLDSEQSSISPARKPLPEEGSIRAIHPVSPFALELVAGNSPVQPPVGQPLLNTEATISEPIRVISKPEHTRKARCKRTRDLLLDSTQERKTQIQNTFGDRD